MASTPDTDAITANLIGLCAAALGEDRVKRAFPYDVKHGLPMGELPALAVYAAGETTERDRADARIHTVQFRFDYYLGPASATDIATQWARLRKAYALIDEAFATASHPEWPTPIVPTPDPPQDPAPGTPLWDLDIGFQAVTPPVVQYGYFHPVDSGTAPYFGAVLRATVTHEGEAPLTEDDLLTDLRGLVRLPAEGALPVVSFVEFRAI